MKLKKPWLVVLMTSALAQQHVTVTGSSSVGVYLAVRVLESQLFEYSAQTSFQFGYPVGLHLTFFNVVYKLL